MDKWWALARCRAQYSQWCRAIRVGDTGSVRGARHSDACGAAAAAAALLLPPPGAPLPCPSPTVPSPPCCHPWASSRGDAAYLRALKEMMQGDL